MIELETPTGSAAKPGVRVIETIAPSSGEALESAILTPLIGQMQGYPLSLHADRPMSRERFLRAVLDGPERFRHIAAHGNQDGFFIGSRKTHVGASHFAQACGDRRPLQHRFLTVSACGRSMLGLWDELHEATGLEAVVAPMGEVWFADAALFFTNLYFAITQVSDIRRRAKTENRLTDFIDSFQRAKASTLALGVRGAYRLVFWDDERQHIIT